MSDKNNPKQQKRTETDTRNDLSLSIFIREDEIFTGEEAVFTLHFNSKEKLKSYFPAVDQMADHEYFVKTNVQKPLKTRIIVRLVHP